MSMVELDYRLFVFGRVWPFKFGFCLGLDGCICIFRDWALEALNPLPLYAVYIYDECFISNFPEYVRSKYELSSHI